MLGRMVAIQGEFVGRMRSGGVGGVSSPPQRLGGDLTGERTMRMLGVRWAAGPPTNGGLAAFAARLAHAGRESCLLPRRFGWVEQMPRFALRAGGCGKGMRRRSGVPSNLPVCILPVCIESRSKVPIDCTGARDSSLRDCHDALIRRSRILAARHGFPPGVGGAAGPGVATTPARRPRPALPAAHLGAGGTHSLGSRAQLELCRQCSAVCRVRRGIH